ncbi:MAG: hypothetical protein HYW15_02255 [Candidatus Giovannonibacteria bacterium]|nr:MAG: hypothetical protein HYW15_02255 [Candidatus Giovannonibacteria bacterium]
MKAKNVRSTDVFQVIVVIVLTLLVLFGVSCVPAATVRRTSVSQPLPPEPAPGQPGATAPAYAGRKATISMAPVEGINLIPVKWGGVGVAPEINSVFESALADTGRFRTVSREKIKNVLAEQDLATAGRVRQSTAVKTGEITGSDLMIIAKITGFDPGDSGVGAAVGAVGRTLGGWIGALGVLAGGIKTSSLVMDVQVMDVRTSEIVVSTTVEGSSVDWSAGGAFVGRSLGAGVAGWKNTPMEKNLRVVVEKAAAEVSAKLPPEYFKH